MARGQLVLEGVDHAQEFGVDCQRARLPQCLERRLHVAEVPEHHRHVDEALRNDEVRRHAGRRLEILPCLIPVSTRSVDECANLVAIAVLRVGGHCPLRVRPRPFGVIGHETQEGSVTDRLNEVRVEVDRPVEIGEGALGVIELGASPSPQSVGIGVVRSEAHRLIEFSKGHRRIPVPQLDGASCLVGDVKIGIERGGQVGIGDGDVEVPELVVGSGALRQRHGVLRVLTENGLETRDGLVVHPDFDVCGAERGGLGG